MTGSSGGTVADLQDRLAQVRAALADMPPHSGSGTRLALQEEVMRLERLLSDRR
jgi:hypothetical protein